MSDNKTPARPFDPHRRPATPALRDLVQEVMQQLEAYETCHGLRKRRRSVQAQATHAETVAAIVCDLIYRELEHPGGRVHVSQSHQVLRKASRYKGKAMGKTLPDVLKVLSAPEMNVIQLVPGKPGFTGKDEGWTFTVKGKQTVMTAGSKLLSRIASFGISFADIGRSEGEEILLLRGAKDRNDRPGPLVEYTDTEETLRLRQDLKCINDWLQQADIECNYSSVNSKDRRLRRIFNNADFGQGGRLYGGFWQAMSGTERLNSLSIEDDSCAELDYGQTGLLLLYAQDGEEPPKGDLYDLSAYGIPETCRPGVKKVLQAAINASKPLDRLPQGSRKTIPKRITLTRLKAALHQRHPAIAHRFGTGVGLTLMRKEADILVDVLLALKDRNITALPVHDAVLVNGNHDQDAQEVMIQVFRKHTGLVPDVSITYP
ncbi:hypothetical protein [Primorskyibacter sp. 2E233]|uniref:hypothetical protein n=1 Tax=Primorskyibacter sp. 2E233 TaxID=3413431 RepID=UPI003BF42BCE